MRFSHSFGFLKEIRDIRGAIANSRKLSLYLSLIGHAYYMHGLFMANPILGWLNLQPSSHVFDTCLAAVDARKKNDEVRRDMMEQWLEVRRTYPDRMADKEILAAAVVTMGAGADTISTTMQTIIYHLLRNSKHLLRLREDLDVAYSRGELSPIVSFAETQKLPFLQACVSHFRSLYISIKLTISRPCRSRRPTASTPPCVLITLAWPEKKESPWLDGRFRRGYKSPSIRSLRIDPDVS